MQTTVLIFYCKNEGDVHSTQLSIDLRDQQNSKKGFFVFVLFLFCFVLFCFVLFCFVLFCFVLFCFVLFCFVLFCFVLLFVCFSN